jgi:hypothetical protein
LSLRITKIALAAALAVLALGALTASASASIVNANFSASLLKTNESTFTIKRGTESKTCTAHPVSISVSGGRSFLGSNSSSEGTVFGCPDLTKLEMRWAGEAKYDTVAERYYLHIGAWSSQALHGPWGWWSQSASDWTWVNGSESTPSTITVNELVIGHNESPFENITISGTFTVKTSIGGLVTLSH